MASQAPLILVVEDEQNTRKRLVLMLRGKGFRVLSARNGKEALERIGQELPDLVISDIQMDEMDGEELLRKIRADAKTRNLPFLVLTVHGAIPKRVEILRKGADDFVTKPIHTSELLARVQSLLRFTKNYPYLTMPDPSKPPADSDPNGRIDATHVQTAPPKPQPQPPKPQPSKPPPSRGQVSLGGLSDPSRKSQTQQASGLIRHGQYKEAIDVLEERLESAPQDDQAKKYLLIAREKHVRELFSDQQKAVTYYPYRRSNNPETIIQYGFSSEESYVYSIMHTPAPIRNLVKDSGLDRRKTLELILKLYIKGAIDLCDKDGVPQ